MGTQTETTQDDRLALHAGLADASVFKDWTGVQPRQTDVDLMGHVNHAVLATYFELARMTVMAPLDKPEGGGFMLGDLHIRYRAEVNVSDDIRVGTKIVRIGNSSFTMGQGLFINNTRAKDLCAATCLSTLVHVDRAARRPAPLPDIYRESLKTFL